MFLKLDGVTGEAGDTDHKGEIEVVSWSWGLHTHSDGVGGRQRRAATIDQLEIVKRVDQSSPTLMNFLRNHKNVAHACLVVRKAGEKPLEYLRIEMEEVRVADLVAESADSDLVERIKLAFSRVTVTYTPQGKIGAKGGGANVFSADAYAEK